jgi:hypothetical protein
LPGLRENFNPRARWRTAINSTRALLRLHAGVTAAKSNGANGALKTEIPSDDDDDDDDAFPLPASRKSSTSTSKLLAGETEPQSTKESVSPTPPTEVAQPPAEEDREKKSPGSPLMQKNTQQQSQVEQIVEDTSRMSIQTDDIPMPGSYFRKHHASQGDGDEQSQNLHRWLPRWFRSNRS